MNREVTGQARGAIVRRLWRAMRDTPLAGAVVRGLDRVVWARRIGRSGLVDSEFYAAQRGWSRAGNGRAICDYVIRGHRRGLSLNPLFDELVAGRGLPESHRVPALYAYLVSDRWTVVVHPWWEARSVSVDPRLPPLEDAWATRDASSIDVRVAGVLRTIPVGEFRHWALEAAREWHRGQNRAPRGDREGVVVRMLQLRDRDYPRRVESAAALSAENSVIVAAIGCEAGQGIALGIAARLHPGLGFSSTPSRSTYGAAIANALLNAGDRHRVLCVVGPRSDLSPAEIQVLQGGVQEGVAIGPVEIAPDGTVAAVGAAGLGATRLYPILEGHPTEDLVGLADALHDVPLLSGPSFAVPWSDWRSAGGVLSARDSQMAVADFFQRVRKARGDFRCVVDARVLSTSYAPDVVFRSRRRRQISLPFDDDRVVAERLLAVAGFTVDQWPTSGDPAPVLRWVRPTSEALRWSLKICAPAGPAGAVWGDTHFAQGLARALRRRGHFVSVDSFDARDRPTNYLEDVTLVVRGPYRIDPPSTGTRVQWIISHPDKVTREELTQFDLVYAASHRWSSRTSQRWGIDVEPLLECTDSDQFYPRGLPRSDDIVFVGTARGIARPSVVVPLAAGIPVKVYGPDWRTYIPASAIAAESIPNEDLSARYETASIVLNDQWPAMKREGFIAMRPFDVVAAGGRVISEYVEGIDEVFGDAVPVFHDARELVDLLRRDPSEVFPDDQRLREASERIRRDHSFDARAALLDSDVRSQRELLRSSSITPS